MEPLPDVALVAPYPPSGIRHGGESGVASYTANLASSLAGAGARVRVIADELPGEVSLSRDGPVVVDRCFRRGPMAVPRATRAAARTGAQVIHLQLETFLYGGPSALPGLVASLATLRSVDPPTVVTLHQVVDPSDVDEEFTGLHGVGVPSPVARAGLAALQEAVGRLAARVVVHEPSFADVVPGATVIPHGIEPVGPDGDRTSARERLGVEGFTALCFGFLAPYKGLEHVLEAASIGGPWRPVIAGGAHPRHGAGYARRLRHAWQDTARFTGYVPDEDVADWFRAVDVALFCYPHPHASSGGLALALAHGTPFLVSPQLGRVIGAPSEAVVPLEAAAIDDRLRRLAAEHEAREELAAACAWLAEGRAWPAVARRHLELYGAVSS